MEVYTIQFIFAASLSRRRFERRLLEPRYECCWLHFVSTYHYYKFMLTRLEFQQESTCIHCPIGESSSTFIQQGKLKPDVRTQSFSDDYDSGECTFMQSGDATSHSGTQKLCSDNHGGCTGSVGDIDLHVAMSRPKSFLMTTLVGVLRAMARTKGF